MIESFVAANIVRPARREHEQKPFLILLVHAFQLGLPARFVLRVLPENRDDAGYGGGTGPLKIVVGDRTHDHVAGAVPCQAWHGGKKHDSGDDHQLSEHLKLFSHAPFERLWRDRVEA